MNLIFRSINIALLVTLNCLGTGGLTIVPLISAYQIKAFLAWIFTAIGSLGIGMVFVELCSKNKDEIQTTIAKAFPPQLKVFVERSVFVMYWLFAVVGNAAAPIIIVEGLKGLFPRLQRSWVIYLFIFLTVRQLNSFGIGNTKFINNSLSMIKVSIMLGIPLICLYKLKFDIPINLEAEPNFTNLKAIGLCMFKTLWPFTGVESISMESGTKNKKALRNGLMLGIGTCSLIYILNTFVMMKNIPNLEACKIPDQILFRTIFPNHSYIFNFTLIIIGLSALQGWSHIAAGMLKDAPFKVPRYANWLIYLIPFSIILMTGGDFSFVFNLATVMLLFVYFAGLVAFARTSKGSWLWFFIAAAYFILAVVGFMLD
jgi:amino acid transporter